MTDTKAKRRCSPYTLFNSVKNKNLEAEDGVWVELERAGFVLDVKLRRAGGMNFDFEVIRNQYLLQSLQDETNTDTIQAKTREATFKAFLEAVLIDWKDIEDLDGNQIEFSAENAAKLFSELPEFYMLAFQQASMLSNFKTNQAIEDGEVLGKS